MNSIFSKNISFIVTTVLFSSYVLAQNVPTYSNSRDSVTFIKIQESDEFQTIDNFGASDAWSAQFVGRWPEAKKNTMADLLFSSENDEQGNPKGIGLSLWRFNLGAGSAA